MKQQIIKWFAHLNREIAGSPLGAIGLFMGIFGTLLALLTSWLELIRWLESYFIYVVFAISLTVVALLVLKKAQEYSDKLDNTGKAEMAMNLIMTTFEKGRPLLYKQLIDKLAQHFESKEMAEQLLVALETKGKIARKRDGSVLIK